jgi:hypothetical protein
LKIKVTKQVLYRILFFFALNSDHFLFCEFYFLLKLLKIFLLGILRKNIRHVWIACDVHHLLC